MRSLTDRFDDDATSSDACWRALCCQAVAAAAASSRQLASRRGMLEPQQHLLRALVVWQGSQRPNQAAPLVESDPVDAVTIRERA